MNNTVRNVIYIILGILMIGAFIYLGGKDYSKDINHTNDGSLMVRTFPALDKNNIYQKVDSSEIVNLLNEGTGIVLFCYKEAIWCNQYALILNRISLLMGIKRIYYYDILEERETKSYYYQQIVNKGKEFLYQDELGKPMLLIPMIYFLKDGELIDYNNDVAIIQGLEKPTDYWTIDNTVALEIKLQDSIQKFLK